ncbi:hypothetical protein CDAR_436241 [Caerostris darwini]|uniref:Uncharacterized protein n=1 Tax=Caerostris darwini TaxID=1538125 RepID=A0AAV4RAM0_9ARAC|nr:hypothetical protein CDAR_436241 [Caerostris darwini]
MVFKIKPCFKINSHNLRFLSHGKHTSETGTGFPESKYFLPHNQPNYYFDHNQPAYNPLPHNQPAEFFLIRGDLDYRVHLPRHTVRKLDVSFKRRGPRILFST